jgi:hypothetical protein
MYRYWNNIPVPVLIEICLPGVSREDLKTITSTEILAQMSQEKPGLIQRLRNIKFK